MRRFRTWKEISQEGPFSRDERSFDHFFSEEASDSRIVIDELMKEEYVFDIEALRHARLKLVTNQPSSTEKQNSETILDLVAPCTRGYRPTRLCPSWMSLSTSGPSPSSVLRELLQRGQV